MALTPPKFSILFFFLLSNLMMVAQNERIQLLEEMLPELSSDTAIINTWNELSYEYYRSDIQKTIYYSELALEKSRSINFPKGVAQALNFRAIAYDVGGNPQKALEYNNASLAIGRTLKNDLLIANALNDMGITYSEINLPDQAMKAYLEALTHYKRTDSENIIFCLENIGNLFSSLGEKQKAEEYSSRAISLAQQSTDHKMRYYLPFSKALDFLEVRLFDSAEFYFQLALEETTSLATQSFILSHIGFLHLEKGNYEYAQKSTIEALHLLEQSGNLDLVLQAANNYAYVLLKTKAYQKCIDVLQAYLANYNYYQNYNDLEKTYGILSEANTALGNYQNANQHLRSQLAIKDSIAHLEQSKIIAAQEVKIATQKQEEENIFLREQQIQNQIISKKNREVTLSMAAVVGLLISLVILLLIYQRQNKRFNRQLKELVNAKTQKLQQTNAALKSSNKELERFAYIASHDLREPLRNISGFSSLITKKLDFSSKNATTIHEYLTYIRSNTRQMDQLIKNILEYSRLETETTNTTPVAIKDVLEEVMQSLQFILKERNVQLTYHPETFPVVLANSQQLFMVFKNLISNGITYNDSKLPEISITYEALDDTHQFSISDNGIGIKEEFQDQIFDLFKRLHSRQEYEGTGIGLAICHKVVQKLGGSLSVHSSGQGSTFVLSIPIDKDELIDTIASPSTREVLS